MSGGVWYLVVWDIVAIVTFYVGDVAKLFSACGRDIGSCVGTGRVPLRSG